MSNREQRNSPGNEEAGEPRPASLAEELTAVLNLIATQKKAERASGAAEPQAAASDATARYDSRADLNFSAAIDRLQEEIRLLNERFVEEENSGPAFSDGPWDPESAEALARSYEAVFAEMHDRAAAERTQLGARRRDELEERFADIAHKLESSLANARDASPMHRLDGRLESMEARICEALDGLARRSDLEALRPGSAFDAMASEFGRAAVKLSRLDTIEGNLADLLDRLSDERLYGDGPASAAPQIDVDALAEATADSVVARLSEMGIGRVDAAEIAEIRQSINVIMDERRRHDEHSMAILDTLQQAMISVLDRVDELGQQIGPGAHASQSEARQPSATPASEPADFSVSPAYPQPQFLPLEDALTSYALDHAPRSPEPDAGGLTPIERVRQELIADAKRAKEQASAAAAKERKGKAKAQAASDAPRNPSADLKGASPHVIPGEGGTRVVSRRRTAPVQNGTIFGIQRRKLLVGSVIILFAAAGALMMMRATSSKAPSEAPAAAVEQPVGAAPVDAAPADAVPAHAPELKASPDFDAPAAAPPADSAPGEGSLKPIPEADPQHTGRADAKPIQHDALPADTSRPIASNISGVTLQHSKRAMTPAQFAELSERQAMAHLSTELGERAVRATPAALFPDPQANAGAPAAVSVANPEPDPSLATRTPLNLPAASVGPMSLRIAAAKGDPSAEFEVGARLAEGKGTDQDFKEAARWYQRSASQGFAQAQYRLGTLYERGLGMPKDLARARVWYERAALGGNIKAMHNLAVLSAQQTNGEPDYATAAKWFAAAAERGLADSQYNLAILHENGLGTDRDLKEAYVYYALAAQSGDAEAKRRQQVLHGSLAAGELSEAEDMLRAWRRKPADRLANDARAAGEDWKQRADNGYGTEGVALDSR